MLRIYFLALIFIFLSCRLRVAEDASLAQTPQYCEKVVEGKTVKVDVEIGEQKFYLCPSVVFENFEAKKGDRENFPNYSTLFEFFPDRESLPGKRRFDLSFAIGLVGKSMAFLLSLLHLSHGF